MMFLVILAVGVAAFCGTIMLVYLAITGQPPTPRRLATSLTKQVRVISQTLRRAGARGRGNPHKPHRHRP